MEMTEERITELYADQQKLVNLNNLQKIYKQKESTVLGLCGTIGSIDHSCHHRKREKRMKG